MAVKNNLTHIMKKVISRVTILLLYKEIMHLNSGSKQHHLERFNEACLTVNLGRTLLQAEGKISFCSYQFC